MKKLLFFSLMATSLIGSRITTGSIRKLHRFNSKIFGKTVQKKIYKTPRRAAFVALKALYRDDAAIQQSIESGKIREVKQITQDLRNKFSARFKDVQPIFAAIHAKSTCPVCYEKDITMDKFNVGSQGCFHFVCTPCKQKWPRLCPLCRKPHSIRLAKALAPLFNNE